MPTLSQAHLRHLQNLCYENYFWLYIEHELAFNDVAELATHIELVSGAFLALEDHMAD